MKTIDVSRRSSLAKIHGLLLAIALAWAVSALSVSRRRQVVRAANRATDAAALADRQLSEPATIAVADEPAADDAPSADTTDNQAGESTKESKKPAGTTHTVRKEPFKIEATLEGVFEASNAHEIILHPEEWSKFTVLSAVEPGTNVKQGDVLVEFDARDIDRAIRDLEQERELTYLAIQQAEDELKFAEQETPLELEAAEQLAQMAAQQLKNWEQIDRDYAEKLADYSLRSARQRVEYVEEELKQLEKMYEADDLTEETEEIILKRQREALEFAKFYFERYQIEYDRALSQTIPWEDQMVQLQARLAEITLARTQAAAPTTLGRKKLELAKPRYEQSKSDERLSKLQSDRALMTVHAPADGLVYYGGPVRGEWPQSASMAEKLRRGGSVSPHQAIMTVVAPRPMFVRAKLPEKELSLVSVNQQGKAVPNGFDALKLSAAVSQISPIPVSEGQFEARVTVDLGPGSEALVPGMHCKVKLVPYQKSDAVAVPTKAVFTDDLDDARRYVYVVDEEGEHSRRDVTVGKASGERTEIVEGLADGEQILLEKPSE